MSSGKNVKFGKSVRECPIFIVIEFSRQVCLYLNNCITNNNYIQVLCDPILVSLNNNSKTTTNEGK